MKHIVAYNPFEKLVREYFQPERLTPEDSYIY